MTIELVKKSQPGSSDVHVETPEWKKKGEDLLKEFTQKFLSLVGKDDEGTGNELDTETRDELHNNDFAIPEKRKYPIHDISHARNALARVAQFGSPEEKKRVHAAVHAKYPTIGKAAGPAKIHYQRLIEGMDWETQHGVMDVNEAQNEAERHLADDPDYYRKMFMKDNSTDDILQKDTTEQERSPYEGEGYNIDLGSGNAREFGHFGFDIYPYDHATIVHDLDTGIPLPSGSASMVRMSNSLHEVAHPENLIGEIERVLCEGGEFHYDGPDDIYDPEMWEENFPNLIIQDHSDSVQKGDCFQQKFTKLAKPDPATANDAFPRAFSDYDYTSPDRAEEDAIGYYWGDNLTSAKGNILYGYASQGAGVSKVAKGGPGSGGGETKPIDMPHSPHISVGGRKGVLENMAYFEDVIPMEKITHVGQEKYVPEKLNRMMKNYDEVKDKPIDVLKVGDEYHVIDGHHRFLAAKAKKADIIMANVRVRAENAHVRKSVKVMKADKMKQIVYGVVLEPDMVDYQDDYMTAEEIEKTAHQYMTDYRIIGSQHDKPVLAHPVESYIAPQDFDMDGQNGPQKIKKGSWVLGVKVVDPKEWEKVVNGEYTGFSVGGMGSRS